MRIGFHDRNKSLAGERMTWMTEVLKSLLLAPSGGPVPFDFTAP